MDELLGLGGETVQRVNLLLDEVLHSFHVVVGHLLNILDTLGISLCEVAVDVTQRFKKVMVKISQLRQGQFTQRDEILNLNTHPIAYQRIF